MAAILSVSNLAVVGGQNQFTATWDYDEGEEGRCLPDLQLAAVELHASADDNRANATKVAEGINSTEWGGLATDLTRYFWVRARDNSGQFSAWFPVSATAGIEATTKFVQTADIEDGAVTVPKLSVDELSAITANFGDANFTGSVKSQNGSTVQIYFSTAGGPGGLRFSFG